MAGIYQNEVTYALLDELLDHASRVASLRQQIAKLGKDSSEAIAAVRNLCTELNVLASEASYIQEYLDQLNAAARR